MNLRRITVQRYFKKAQLEMNETIMVLFAVFIILGIGFFLYYKFAYQGLRSLGSEITEEESSILLVSVASLPEIGCDKDVCLDAAKLSVFKAFSSNNLDYYKKKWGFRKIWVEQVYPVIKDNRECSPTQYNSLDYPDNCKYWILYENKPSRPEEKILVSSVYPLYFPEKDKYRIARLNIEVYK